jgi:uncharacterized protein involved in propanediol utilization
MGSVLGTMFDLFTAHLTANHPLASSRHNYFAFVPEGLHLDRGFTANNPG